MLRTSPHLAAPLEGATVMDYKQETVSHQERRDHSASVHESVNRISLIVGVLVTIAMIFDNHSITRSTIAGVSFYGLVAGMLIMAPHVTQMAIAHMHEVTTRRYNELPYAATQHAQDAHNRLSVVQPLQLDYTRPVEAPRLPVSATFVAPTAEPDDSAKREAAAWVLQLFGPTGEPDPKKVLMQSDKERPGRIRIAAPSRSAKEYLLNKHIIHDLGNGYRLNLVRYPTITAVQNQLMTYSVPPGTPTTHPHPMIEGQVAQ